MCEEAEMKKDGKNQKKDSMNLQKMYEQRLTPQRKVEAFRRYVIKLKRQRNFGREMNYYDYIQADIRLFREEALYMKGLDAEYDTNVRLSKEIRCLEEMNDEQILCYYTLVKRFRDHAVERTELFYARYYFLELANLIYQDTPREAYEAMFSFWDVLEKERKISDENREYFYTVCRLFMLAFPELMPEMIDRLEKRDGRDWSGRAYESIEKGEYEAADLFVRQNARGLKEKERYPEKEYAVHAWKALPYVFRMLERDLKAYDFRHMILNGFYAFVYIGEYPVMCSGKREKKMVQVSKYMYYEYQDFSDYWKFWYYVLRESVQDLLFIIYQYTETRMRWHFKAPARKGSVNRIISKAYVTGTDRPQDVAKIKELLQDDQFQESIEDGVLDYLTTEDVPLPERKQRSRRTAKKTVQEMDYEEIRISAAIDREKLKRAKADAEQVLGMLSEGEIGYETETAPDRSSQVSPPENTAQMTISAEDRTVEKQERASDTWYREGAEREKKGLISKTAHKDSPKYSGYKEEPVPVNFTSAEKQYLRFLRAGDRAAAEEYLHTVQVPEAVMMKQINQKALDLFGDFLLEKEAGRTCILEDYEKETDRILEEGP